MRKLIPALLLALLTLALAAGCGGGGSENASDTEPAITETTAVETEAVETEAAETVTTETETTVTATTEDNGDLTDFSSADNCRELGELSSKLQTAYQGVGSDFEKTKKFFNELADKAPEEIRDDFRVIADFWVKIAEAFKGVKPGTTPTPQQLQKLQSLQNAVDQKRLTQASTNIANWAAKNCKA